MPRPAKGARLYLRHRKGKESLWIIRDGETVRGTGCGADDREGAEKALQAYLADKHAPDFGKGDPAAVSIADCLALYGKEVAPAKRRPDVIGSAIVNLLAYWGADSVGKITPGRCRAYVDWRTAQPQARFKDPKTAPKVGAQTARRELEVLSAALGYAHKEHKLLHAPPIALPDKAPGRERWLTRSEVARLLWACRATGNPHVARFIIMGVYSGTRHDAILGLRWTPATDTGWVDLGSGLIHRRGLTEIETTKRRPAMPIPPRLAGHLRRWKKGGGAYVVSFDGSRLARVRRAWKTVVKKAGLGPDVVPHVMKHTFCTWAVSKGVPLGLVAAAVGTSEKVIRDTYGKYAPAFLAPVFDAVTRR